MQKKTKILIGILVVGILIGGILTWQYFQQSKVILNPEEIKNIIYIPDIGAVMLMDIAEVEIEKDIFSIKPGKHYFSKLEADKKYSCDISEKTFDQIVKEIANMVNTAKRIYNFGIHSPSYSAIITLTNDGKISLGSSGPTFINGKAYSKITPGFTTLKQEAYDCLETVLQKSTKNETADWKIYSNPEVDFIFKYPKDWEIRDYEYKSAACQVNPKCEGAKVVELSKIGETKTLISINMPQCSGIKRSDLPGNNWICLFDEDFQIINIYDQMLSTFKFFEIEEESEINQKIPDETQNGSIDRVEYSKIKEKENAIVYKAKITVNIPEIEVRKIENHITFIVPDGMSDAETCGPVLPLLIIPFYIPYISEVKNIKVVDYENYIYPEKIEKEDFLIAVPMTSRGQVECPPFSYTNPYPEEIFDIQEKGTEWKGGYWYPFNLTPIQYNPNKKEVKIYKKIVYEIEFERKKFQTPYQNKEMKILDISFDNKNYKSGDKIDIDLRYKVEVARDLYLTSEIRGRDGDRVGELVLMGSFSSSGREMLIANKGENSYTASIKLFKNIKPGSKYLWINLMDAEEEVVIDTRVIVINIVF